MKKRSYLFAALLLVSTLALSQENILMKEATLSEMELAAKLKVLNEKLIVASKQKNIPNLLSIYTDDALLLAEYQALIDGKEGIKSYYSEIFRRQDIQAYSKETKEVFNFGEHILEIGIFNKELKNEPIQAGTYWNLWEFDEKGDMYLSAETFGFLKDLENPQNLAVDNVPGSVWTLSSRKGVNIPLEFDAYSALMENIVRDRDTPKMLELYTEDGSYTPFADTTKAGIKNLTKHYFAYHKNPVVIDSIESATYDFIYVPDGVIRITQFYVEWTVPGYSGKNEGTGISYWRRQADNSLKIHRQIAHHTYLKN